MAESLERFGTVEPIVWNEETGHVVGGHQRLAILLERGVEEVDVSVVRLTEAREKALMLALNNGLAQGRWEPDRLAALIEEITAEDPSASGALRLGDLIIAMDADAPAPNPFDRDPKAEAQEFAKRQGAAERATTHLRLVCRSVETDAVLDAIRIALGAFDGARIYV